MMKKDISANFHQKGLIVCSKILINVLEKSELPWKQNFFIAVGVFAVELLACQVSLACVKNWLY